MTGDRKTARDALDRLADALVDDILSASDEDILVETSDAYGDPDKLAGEMRALFEKTVQEEGKAKLTAATKAAAPAKKAGPSVVRLDSAEARRRYDRMVAGDSSLSTKLTMAARKGEGESKRDIEGAIEDLAELGAFDEEDNDT